MMAHVFNFSTWEVEVDGSLWVPGHPGWHSKSLSQSAWYCKPSLDVAGEVMDSRRNPTNCHFPKQVEFVTTFKIFILTFPDKCSFHPLPKKLLYGANRDHYRDLQVVRMQSQLTAGCSRPADRYICITTPTTKSQGTPRNKRQKDCRSQRPRMAASQCPLHMTGKLHP